MFILLSFAAVSCYSLFPLLFEPQEYPLKILLLAIHAILMWLGFCQFRLSRTPHQRKMIDSRGSCEKDQLIGWAGACYLLGLFGVELWGQLLHPYFFGDRLPFLPLMLVSIYCAMGMMYSWAWQLRQIVRFC